MEYLEYKDFKGTITFSKEDKLLFGKIMGVKGLLSYEGQTRQELERDFRQAVDAYLVDGITE